MSNTPTPDQPAGPEQTYFQMLESGTFHIQQCTACSKHVFYPRAVCPHCGGGELNWVEPSGKGTVYSTTTVRRKPDAGGDYNVALVDLAEGVRLMSRVEGVAPDAVEIGMAVRAQVARQDGKAIVVFRAEGGAA